MTYLEDGQPRGLAVDLVQALAKPLGRPIRIELMDWREAQDRVLRGEADGLLEMGVSAERLRHYDFSSLSFVHQYSLFIRTGEMRIHGVNDLRGLSVGVTAGGFPRQLLEPEPGINLVFVENSLQGLRRVAAGEIDAFAGDLWVGGYTIQKENLSGVTVLKTPLATQPAGIALRKGNQVLLAEINRGLAVLEDEGVLAKVRQQWQVQEMVILSRRSVRSIVVWSIGGAVGALLLIMGGWVWSLKRQIRVRREAELALRESNERIRSLSDNLPNGMIYQLAWERDGSRRFLHVSATVEKIHGVTVAEALVDAGILYRQLIREDRAIVEEAEARSARTGELFQMEARIRNRQGEMRWVQLTSAPRALPDGRVVWDGIEFDITARKAAEQIAQQSARELQMIFDHSPVGIALLKDRKFVRVNESQATMLGYTAAEFVGQDVRFIYPSQQDYEKVGGELYREIARDGQWLRETTFRCKDDSRVQLHLHVVPADRHDPSAGIIAMSVDLTERKRVEEALRASETRLQEVFDHTTEVIFVVRVEPDGRFFYERINQAAGPLGLNPDDFNSGTKTPQDIFPPASAASVEANYRKCIAAGRPTLVEQELTMPTGVFYFAATLVPVRAADGTKIVRIVGFSQDVTERRRADEALREKQRQLTTFMANLPGVAYRCANDPQWTMEFISEGCLALTGYPVEDFIGNRTLSWADLIHREDQGPVWEQVQRNLKDREPYDLIYRLRTREGSERWVAERGRGVFETDGRLQALEGLVTDITLLKLTESALRASEEKYRGIFENALEGIFRSSPEGRYLSVNPSMARMHGYDSPQDMIDSITDIATQIYVNSSERQRVLGRIERDGRIDNHELHVWRKDGSAMWILSSLRAVRDLDGKIVYYEGTNIDITERKRMSALETSAMRAEAASRAKSSFLANMSHEIRTPMNAILGFSQLLMRDAHLSPAQREHLRVIDRNGEHLMALITDILEMSKIEANRATLNRSPFAVTGLARDLESMFRARIEAQGLTFLVETDESCEVRLVGDVGKLRQIFVNLLANAIKFTTTGRIVLRFHTEPQLDESCCLRGEVEDTGAGIPATFLDELFDEFAQTDLGRKTGSGTGLGLPISREFARMMDGDITVETREGHGSTFRMAVILARAAANQPVDLDQSNGRTETPVRLAPGQPERRVLVVDDQPDSRQFLRLLLEGAGFVVQEAANGVEAIADASLWRPHCILMDLRMPVMGGLEAITEIRRHDHGLGMKIISLTASVFAEDRAQVLAAGADRFMTKPVHVSDLFEQIRVLLDVKYIRTGEGGEVAPVQGVLVPDRASIRVPARLIGRLREAVEAADLDLVLALTDEVAAVDESAATEIRRIINRFDYPALLALLDASAEANA